MGMSEEIIPIRVLKYRRSKRRRGRPRMEGIKRSMEEKNLMMKMKMKIHEISCCGS